MKLTSSVLPGAIQMLTAYMEKLEQIQKAQDALALQEHHNHFTSTTPVTDEVDAEKISYNSSSTVAQSSVTPGPTTVATSASPTVAINPEGGQTGTPLGYIGHPETPPITTTSTNLNSVASETTQAPSISTLSPVSHENHPEVHVSTANPTVVSEGQMGYNINATTPSDSGLPISYQSGTPETISTSTPSVETVTESNSSGYSGNLDTSPSTSAPIVQVTQNVSSERLEIVAEVTSSNTKIEPVVAAETTQTGSSQSAEPNLQAESNPETPTPYNATSEATSTTIANLGQPEYQNNTNTSINSTVQEVEEIYIPDELYALITSQSEVTNIPTEAYVTTTESAESSTNIYELNINEETIVDIELILGDKTAETKAHNGESTQKDAQNGTNIDTRIQRRLRDEDLKKKVKNSHADRNVDKHKTPNDANTRPNRNTTSVNKFNAKPGHPGKPLPPNNVAFNKTSNIVKTTLQNILAQQKNKTMPLKPTKGNVSSTLSDTLLKDKNNTRARPNSVKTPISSKTGPEELTKFGPHFMLNHLKESHFNKTTDEIFVNTLNDIIDHEQKKLENNTREDVKVKNETQDDLMSKFWSLASFFTALQHFVMGGHPIVQQAQNVITEKREENYLKNVTRQMMFLKVFYNIEAKNSRLWRYHVSKNCFRFSVRKEM